MTALYVLGGVVALVPLLYAYRLWSTTQAPDLSNGLDEEPTVVPEPTPKKLPHPTFRCQFGHTHRVTRITDAGPWWLSAVGPATTIAGAFYITTSVLTRPNCFDN